MSGIALEQEDIFGNLGLSPERLLAPSLIDLGNSGLYQAIKDAAFLAYSWKLPAYSGAFLLAIDILAFLLTIGACSLTILTCSLTIRAFWLTMGKCV